MPLTVSTIDTDPAAYPATARYTDAFGYRDYLKALAAVRTRAGERPLALCLHLAEGGASGATYASYLMRELEMHGRLLDGIYQLAQLRLVVPEPRIAPLMAHLRRCFSFADGAALALTLDAGSVDPARLAALGRLGFQRLGLVTQDGAAPLRALVEAARAAGFVSVGLTVRGAADPQALIAAAPDRIDGAPCGAALEAAGYRHIGLGQFARADDELAVAQRQGRLYRSCHAYSAQPFMDQLACGVGAASSLAGTCSQNVKTRKAYYDLIERNELPIGRGMRLSMDDTLRHTIIERLVCQFELSTGAIEQAYPIAFADYFGAELAQLRALAQQGLVALEGDWISVTDAGRALIGSVCQVFKQPMGARQR